MSHIHTAHNSVLLYIILSPNVGYVSLELLELQLSQGRHSQPQILSACKKENGAPKIDCYCGTVGKSFFLLEFMRQARVQGKAVLYHTPQGYRFYPAGPDVNYCWELGNTFHAQTTPQDLWGGKESSVVYITDGVDPRCGEPADALTFAALPADAEFMPVSGANSTLPLVYDMLRWYYVVVWVIQERTLETEFPAHEAIGAV